MLPLTLVLLSLAQGGLEPRLIRVSERHRVPSTVSVELNPLAQSIVLRGRGLTVATEKALRKESELCGEVTRTKPDTLQLGCTTNKLFVNLETSRKETFLVISEIRVVPWGDVTAVPLRPYSPRSLEVGYDCENPQHPVAQGECALAQGDLLSFGAHVFRDKDLPWSRLRRGDFALLNGDVLSANELYQSAGGYTPIRRLAHARLCELGYCDNRARSTGFDSAGLMAEAEQDVMRRRLRYNAFDGHFDLVIDALRKEGSRTCLKAERFCDELLLLALRDKDATNRGNGLALYSEQPWTRSDHAPLLLEQAAQVAEEAGAFSYAAALLSAETHKVPSWLLGAHLRRIAVLYGKAEDDVRADVIRTYAVSRGQAPAPTPSPVEPLTPSTESALVQSVQSSTGVDIDLARAAVARSRSKQIASSPEPQPPP